MHTGPPDQEDIAAAFDAMTQALALVSIDFARLDRAKALAAIGRARAHVKRDKERTIRNERVWQHLLTMFDEAEQLATHPPPAPRGGTQRHGLRDPLGNKAAQIRQQQRGGVVLKTLDPPRKRNP